MSDERFASWPELLAHVRDRYPATEAHEEGATVVVAGASGRAVSIQLRPVDVLGRPWFEMIAKIGPAQRIPPGNILSRSLGIIVGSSYLVGTTLWLRQLLPLGLAAAAIDEAIRAFAIVADDGAESNRVREDKGIRGKATPWSDWPSQDENEG